MKKIGHELATAILWAIAIAHTLYFVRDTEARSILVTLFAVLMIGCVQIVRLAKRNQVK